MSEFPSPPVWLLMGEQLEAVRWSEKFTKVLNQLDEMATCINGNEFNFPKSLIIIKGRNENSV